MSRSCPLPLNGASPSSDVLGFSQISLSDSLVLDNLLQDKTLASKAVALVINGSRRGFVALCADVAELLRSQALLEKRLQRLMTENEVLKSQCARWSHFDQHSIENFDSRPSSSSTSTGYHSRNHPGGTKLSTGQRSQESEVQCSIGEEERLEELQHCLKLNASLASELGDARRQIGLLKSQPRRCSSVPPDLLQHAAPMQLHGCLCPACGKSTQPMRVRSPTGEALGVGDSVLLADSREGTIRYLGHHEPLFSHLHGPIIVGLEFESPVGNCSGCVKKRSFFHTKPLHATFVDFSSIAKVTSSEAETESTPLVEYFVSDFL